MKKTIRIHPALGIFGIFGFFGLIGFFDKPFFCVFLCFFGFFFWGLLGREKADERLEQNINKATGMAGQMAQFLCFFILFALDRKLPTDTVLLWGSIGYGLVYIASPAIAFIMDKRG